MFTMKTALQLALVGVVVNAISDHLTPDEHRRFRERIAERLNTIIPSTDRSKSPIGAADISVLSKQECFQCHKFPAELKSYGYEARDDGDNIRYYQQQFCNNQCKYRFLDNRSPSYKLYELLADDYDYVFGCP